MLYCSTSVPPGTLSGATRCTRYHERSLWSLKAKFVILANGILTQPKLAVIEGMQSFKGVSFHSSRWDYSVDLRGKTVGIIGTGATAVQAVPAESVSVIVHVCVSTQPASLLHAATLHSGWQVWSVRIHG